MLKILSRISPIAAVGSTNMDDWRAHSAPNWYNMNYSPIDCRVRHEILRERTRLQWRIRYPPTNQAPEHSQMTFDSLTSIFWNLRFPSQNTLSREQMDVVHYHGLRTRPSNELSEHDKRPSRRDQWVTEPRYSASPKLRNNPDRTGKTRMPSKLNGNPETSCEIILPYQNHIATSKIFDGSPGFSADDPGDVLRMG
jgi:hypothetical protein